MAKILFLVTFSVLISAAFASSDYGVQVDSSVKVGSYAEPQKVDTTVIQGYVYCQSCEGKWVKHLAGAKVKAQCKGDYVNSHGSDLTDSYGFYQIKLPHYYNDAKSCTAKIVESNDPSCKIYTNEGNGQQGANVAYLKTHYNEIFFKTSPFAFKQACHIPSY